MVTIQSVYNEFMRAYHGQCSMIADSTIIEQGNLQFKGHSFSHEMYLAIVENCFMQIYLAWEAFLEKSFISYLQNASDLQGNSYLRYGLPVNDEHAYDMLRGTKSYPDWTNIDEVNRLAKIYFEHSGPFVILKTPPAEFLEMKTIRNRISHVSTNSQKQFNTLLARNIAQTNIQPGDYLMMFKSAGQTYFTFYVCMLKDYVEAICNK
ncbi:MAG: hypothetical protein NC081_08145 [Roseburia sp.]|nr:hypothetical protein [Roseburia sp.]